MKHNLRFGAQTQSFTSLGVAFSRRWFLWYIWSTTSDLEHKHIISQVQRLRFPRGEIFVVYMEHNLRIGAQTQSFTSLGVAFSRGGGWFLWYINGAQPQIWSKNTEFHKFRGCVFQGGWFLWYMYPKRQQCNKVGPQWLPLPFSKTKGASFRKVKVFRCKRKPLGKTLKHKWRVSLRLCGPRFFTRGGLFYLCSLKYDLVRKSDLKK